ncbi:MAG: hypothetical protein M0T85_06700 [Dehalococcoidales bacterium]|nr:hypothetical protein [Dehalococcoidales bacterium]
MWRYLLAFWPQDEQNFAAGGSVAPHAAQVVASGRASLPPHSTQKLAFGSLGAPQFEQKTPPGGAGVRRGSGGDWGGYP